MGIILLLAVVIMCRALRPVTRWQRSSIPVIIRTTKLLPVPLHLLVWLLHHAPGPAHRGSPRAHRTPPHPPSLHHHHLKGRRTSWPDSAVVGGSSWARGPAKVPIRVVIWRMITRPHQISVHHLSRWRRSPPHVSLHHIVVHGRPSGVVVSMQRGSQRVQVIVRPHGGS